MKWVKASELPLDCKYHAAKSKSFGLLTAFYTVGGDVEITFDDDYGYEDENGYLLAGWYRVYDSVRDGMHFIVPVSDIIEWLDESEQSEWIPVDKAMPGRAIPVLCWRGGNLDSDGQEISFEDMIDSNGDIHIRAADVTHWMYIPQPPINK
jgi:hypothetical protein